MSGAAIHTLDLNYMGMPNTIAAYLIPNGDTAVLVESGPGSTLPALLDGLARHGYRPDQVSDVLLTHIHLDHAGAAGWLARQGARIHVHPAGAPHLLDPARLLASALRVYGDAMQAMWGQMLPVPPESLNVLAGSAALAIGDLHFTALATPGHAEHHHAYLLDGACFCGDVGGIRIQSMRHLRLPMPPPEFHLEHWRASLECLERAGCDQMAPTHFGLYPDAAWHLADLRVELDAIEAWMEAVMPARPPMPELNEAFMDWTTARARADGLSDAEIALYETANPSWMSPLGIDRYWRKYREKK